MSNFPDTLNFTGFNSPSRIEADISDMYIFSHPEHKEELAALFDTYMSDFKDYPNDPGYEKRVEFEKFRRKSYDDAGKLPNTQFRELMLLFWENSAMQVQALDHINIITTDLDCTADFYVEMFGLDRRNAPPPLTPENARWMFDRCDRAIFHINSLECPRAFDRDVKEV